MNDREGVKSGVSYLALACVGFVSSALMPAAAQAQDSDAAKPGDEGGARKLKGATVTYSDEVQGYKAEVEDSPKYTAPLIDTPRSVVVVPKEVIKETGSATLVDALRTVPGITFGAAEGGNPIGDRPFIRGFDSQGSTYLDGVRDIGAQTREVFDVEQIQVVRGSDSTLGGRGSAGGTLNIVSKMPRNRDFVEGNVSYGTDNYKRVTVDANARLSDNAAFRIDGMWHDQDFAGRDAIFAKRWGISPSLTLGLGTPTRMTFKYYHLSSDELPDSGIPFLYSIGNAPGTGNIYNEPALGTITTIGGVTGTVKRSAFYGLKNRDYRDSRQDQATLRAEHDFGNGVTIRNTARYSRTTQDYSFLLPDDSQGNVFGTSATPVAGNVAAQGGYVWRRANTRFGYSESIADQLDLYGTFKTGAIEHNFSTGIELAFEKAQRGALNISSGGTVSPRCNPTTVARFYCTSLFNPDPNDPWVNYASDTSTVPLPIGPNAPSTTTINDATTTAIYAFDSITISPQLILNVGLRYDDFDTKTTLPVLNGERPRVGRRDKLFNGQAGVVFKPTENTSLYASFATAATPPNALLAEGQEFNGLGTLPAATTPAGQAAAIAALQAAANDALKVEKTRSYEVGGKADLFDSALSLNLAVFQTETKNARVTGPNNTIEFLGERRIRGAEFGINGNITRTLSVFGGYSYLDAKIIDGGFTALTAAAVGTQAAKTVLVTSVNTGKQFPQTAKHSGSVFATWKPIEGLSLGGGAFYTGRVFGGYQDNRSATQTAAGVVTVNPATKVLYRTAPGYVRFDATAAYEINKTFDIRVNVQNLTDKVYYTQLYTSHYAAIAPGRSAFVTLGVKY